MLGQVLEGLVGVFWLKSTLALLVLEEGRLKRKQSLTLLAFDGHFRLDPTWMESV